VTPTVPYTARALSKKPCLAGPGQERRDRTSSGILICELTAITPLCIHSQFRSLGREQPPLIPGSSIRGMVRNVVEVLGAACLRFVDQPPGGAPEALQPCSEAAACLACRVFGFTDGEFSWASKVSFSDARPFRDRGQWSFSWTHCLVARRDTGHRPQSNAWRIFPSAPLAVACRTEPARGTVPCAAAGSRFRFRADYLNLDSEERSVFLFALTLTRDQVQLCHKLGYAKALGLGACQIRIVNTSPAITSEIDPYVSDPVFARFAAERSCP